MSDLFLLLLGVLAVYRLSVLVCLDDGPGDWLVWLRTVCGAYDWERDPTPTRPGEAVRYRPKGNLGRVVSCPRCLSGWLAIPVTPLVWWSWWLSGGWWTLVLLPMVWLALWGGAVFLVEVTGDG